MLTGQNVNVNTLYEDIKPETQCYVIITDEPRYKKNFFVRQVTNIAGQVWLAVNIFHRTSSHAKFHQRFPKDDSPDPKFLFFK